MQTYRRAPFFLLVLTGLLLVSMLLVACGGAAPATNTTGGKSLTSVSIGLGYIPDIQFAPFYVAVNKGYYQEAGLDVKLNHGVVPDLFGEMMAGKDTFVFAGGDDTLVARSKSLPVVDVATIYPSYPISLIVPEASSIKNLADIKGHTIGVPGKYGSTYVGLLALLNAVHLTENDVKLQTIGFTQVSALKSGHVDAVMGYTNNEPLQLRRLGMPVRTFDVPNYQPMVSNGIVTTEKTLSSQASMVRAFVQATIKGLNYVLANPADAVQISKSFIPNMNLTQATDELNATLPIWKGNGQHALGYNDLATWQAMAQFMASEKLIPASSDVSKAFTNV
ncbi:MAG TPA: ABC transporter substrate-binding protein [Ktedonobacteraceae bacterium]|nr:ABC transporter substrate-binding protein [Ktedonobacteraceae bacterium]